MYVHIFIYVPDFLVLLVPPGCIQVVKSLSQLSQEKRIDIVVTDIAEANLGVTILLVARMYGQDLVR